MSMKIVLVIYYLIASSLGLILIKSFFNSGYTISIQNLVVFWDYRIIIGAVLYMSSFLSWFLILAKYELSSIYPIIIGLSYVFIVILSFFLLKEHGNIYRYIGVLLILSGVILIAYKGDVI